MVTEQAYWLAEPGLGEIRAVDPGVPGPDEVLVRTTWSGVSRGTETLVHRGGVPADQQLAMRAPFQEGEFPGPVKYGYLSVGEVMAGRADLRGRTVFCLFPHQTAYVVPAASVVPVPEGVPARRAVLAGLVETAVNAVWDCRPLVGDRLAVVGGGTLGCCVARLLGGIPGARVTLVDVERRRAAVAEALGVAFAAPDEAPRDLDAVVHASGRGEGLETSLGLLADDGEVVDLSWYGDRPVPLHLGGAFHSRRLAIRSSQVGEVARARRGRRTRTERLALALDLLQDPAFDVLLTGESAFDDLPAVMGRLAAGDPEVAAELCHTIRYPAGPGGS